MLTPTSREPVNDTNAVSLCSTSKSTISRLEPGIKFTTPFGNPASSKTSTNLQEITEALDEGFNKTVLPVTKAADVVPAMIAKAKFHGEITRPTPNGI